MAPAKGDRKSLPVNDQAQHIRTGFAPDPVKLQEPFAAAGAEDIEDHVLTALGPDLGMGAAPVRGSTARPARRGRWGRRLGTVARNAGGIGRIVGRAERRQAAPDATLQIPFRPLLLGPHRTCRRHQTGGKSGGAPPGTAFPTSHPLPPLLANCSDKWNTALHLLSID
ncbi:hypothetical protein NHU_02114 [Rhodovulum sulfidophilum]|uniref:Uncharacterized protein n=1 Tax=Rhodovulum sulfidophilum TaxID=35806 RepID=A0A0D6B287_RHOSU|nr:hypothetical protein NHU_02114 [Rhodovulum sulfidophilum]